MSAADLAEQPGPWPAPGAATPPLRISSSVEQGPFRATVTLEVAPDGIVPETGEVSETAAHHAGQLIRRAVATAYAHREEVPY